MSFETVEVWEAAFNLCTISHKWTIKNVVDPITTEFTATVSHCTPCFTFYLGGILHSILSIWTSNVRSSSSGGINSGGWVKVKPRSWGYSLLSLALPLPVTTLNCSKHVKEYLSCACFGGLLSLYDALTKEKLWWSVVNLPLPKPIFRGKITFDYPQLF